MNDPNRPNLLFLFSDQHARHVTGCYGNTVVATPHLDRLAAGGLVFDSAYCPSPICVPSRMSMLTGCYPSQQDCWTNDDCLASDRATWLHAVAAADYRPILVGRLHAMGPDQMHGYAAREIGDHSPNWAGIKRHNLGVLANANDPYRASLTASGIGQSAYEVKDIDATQAACSALDRFAGGAEPFCLSVGFILPHPPYVARPEDYARYETSVGLPRLRIPDEEHPWLAWWRRDRGIADATAEETLRARRAYFALVTRLDAMIGQILDKLEATGLARNTLVVYSSDHGDQLGERGLWWKHTFYEESVAVPLILRWPGRLAAGERRKQIVNLTDVSATMLDALSAPALPNASGRSFLGVARNATASWDDQTFSEYCTDAVPAWTGGQAVRQRMIRRGRWKLVYYHGYAPQLFDLVADPDECRDCAADPTYAETRAELTTRLLADWDPDEIERRMRRRRADKDLIGTWAQKTAPGDQYRWEMRADQNRLDASPP
ncbi:MAG: sulfatase-like hydrolase/transferase [Rhodospirillales bacterium]|jgi:choline-sulfatase